MEGTTAIGVIKRDTNGLNYNPYNPRYNTSFHFIFHVLWHLILHYWAWGNNSLDYSSLSFQVTGCTPVLCSDNAPAESRRKCAAP